MIKKFIDVKKDDLIYIVYPGSIKSFSNKFYTNSDQAFIGLVMYAEKRIKTVGDKMEKLMKELERNEKF